MTAVSAPPGAGRASSAQPRRRRFNVAPYLLLIPAIAALLVALGYRSSADFNAALPKSRLPEAAVISEI